jgi:prevent-host-death family protein
MRIASVADVKAKLSAYVKASERGPVVITRNGKAVAALVSVSDEDEIERLLMGHSPRLRTLLSRARGRIRSGKRLSHEEIWKTT